MKQSFAFYTWKSQYWQHMGLFTPQQGGQNETRRRQAAVTLLILSTNLVGFQFGKVAQEATSTQEETLDTALYFLHTVREK